MNSLRFPVIQTDEGWSNFLKFTWQTNPANRISLQANHDPRRFTGLGIGTRVAPDSDYLVDQGGITGTLRWNYNISPSVLLETLASLYDTSIDVLPGSDPELCAVNELGRCNPFIEDLYTVDERDGTIHGPYYETSRDSRTRYTLKSDLSLFIDADHGTHQIKAGVELARETYGNSLEVRPVRFDNFARAPSQGTGPTGPNLVGFINFEEAVPSGQFREATKDNLGLYIQDSFKPLPNLSINVGLRLDREEASSNGFEPFEPSAEAAQFLRLFEVGVGTGTNPATRAPWGYQDAFESASTVRFDVNNDGLDFNHCNTAGFDADGSTFGDNQPDGVPDDFITCLDDFGNDICFDGDFDGVIDPTSPFDVMMFGSDGIPDGRQLGSKHFLCDRKSDDAFFMLATFHRHQFDDIAAPWESVVNMDPDRGLPGGERSGDDFTIVNNNLAPRLSVSWDPWGDNRTKVFATWSRFYDKLFLATLVPELGPDARTTVYDPNSQLMGAFAVPAQTGRFTVTQVDRDMRTPYTDEMTLGFERELAPEWALSFTYVRRTGREQIQDVDINHYVQDRNGDGILDDNFGTVADIQCSDGPGSDNPCGGGDVQLPGVARLPDGQPDLFAYNPFFNRVLRVGNFNSSKYEAYQLVLTRRLSRKWQMTSSYVYSKAVGDAESFLQGLGNDLGTVDDEHGPLSFDQTHRVVFSGTTFLPGNQTVGGTIEWASGLPYSLVRQGESADSFGSFTYRTTYPTGQRNDVRNEPAWLLKLLYRKHFQFGRVNAAVAVEVDNLLNSDDLWVTRYNTQQFLGVDATRRFGRRWQLSAELHF